MPTILRAKLDGSSTKRYHHFPLSGFYLGIALRSAEESFLETEQNSALRKIVVATTFSAMALEAFANELAENLVSKEKLEEFIALRGEFRRKGKSSSVVFKLQKALALRGHKAIKSSLRGEIESLIKIRNSLVHYKVSESAGVSHLRSPSKHEESDAAAIFSINFLERPIKRELSLIESLSPSIAASHYNAAFDFFVHWFNEENLPNGMDAFKRLSA